MLEPQTPVAWKLLLNPANDEDTTLFDTVQKGFQKVSEQPQQAGEATGSLSDAGKEIELPAKYRAHMLKGDYLGCMECHIESDFLLIWLDPETDVIEILRLGSHSELFKK